MNIKQLLREHSPVLGNLSDGDLTELINLSHEVLIPEGETVKLAESTSDCYCVVLHGQIISTVDSDRLNDHIKSRFGVGETLGETLGEIERDDEVNDCGNFRALEDSRLLCIPQKYYAHLMTSQETLMRSLTEKSHAQTSQLLVAKYLSTLFRTAKLSIADPQARLQVEKEWIEFEDNVLKALTETIEWNILHRGEYLFRQGDEADGAYILVSGVLGVTVQSDEGNEREVDRVNHGEIVGELALVTDEKRGANIVALRDCELFKLPAATFQHITESYPRMMLNIYRTISTRFMHSRSVKPYRPRKSNLSIFTMNQSANLDDFLQAFCSHLSTLDTTTFLNSESVDRDLGTEGIANLDRKQPGNIALMHWLNSHESKSRFVVYRADSDWSEWSWRCVSQADQIVIFADINDAAEFSEFKKNVSITGQKWHLVLLHPENTDRPRNTSHWLDTSGAEQIYHVRQHNADDLARLARILIGRAFSLVLGGGGARGLAHIGILRALDELGVKVDMVGGTSIGAPIAGLVAQGLSPAEIKSRARKAFHRLIDYTLPLTSMIRGKRISKSIDKHTADWDIEDYWLPYFCISTNLTQATQVVHKSGNSARACRASLSIPGVLPPVPNGRDLLVDGGVMNNLPIDVMRNMNPSGTVMAIDVVPPNGSTSKEDYGLELSGWRQLFRSIIPFQKPARAPRIGAVIMQSMVLGSSVARELALKQGLADYYQNIHVKGVGILEFNKLDYAEKIGYQISLPESRKWLEQRNR